MSSRFVLESVGTIVPNIGWMEDGQNSPHWREHCDADTRGRMAKPVQIIGNYMSPYVRKVLVFLDLKGIPYEIDPIIPFFGDDRFAKLSPVRRIPVLIDDLVTLTDSSVICQYLEDRYPKPALFPADIAARA